MFRHSTSCRFFSPSFFRNWSPFIFLFSLFLVITLLLLRTRQKPNSSWFFHIICHFLSLFFRLFAWMWSTSSFCTFIFPTEGVPCAPLFTIVDYILPGYSPPPHDPWPHQMPPFPFDFISHRLNNIVEFAAVLEFEQMCDEICALLFLLPLSLF